MSLGAILVQTSIDDFAEGRVRVAAELADRFGATLIGACACAVQTAPTNGMSVGIDVFLETPAEIEKQLLAIGTRFRDLAQGKGKALEWRSAVGFPGDHVVLNARAADLVVAGRDRGGNAYRTADLADLIMRAGRPVLVVPADVAHLAADRIVVAWKDTREARRAVLDSLPLLEKATEVTVAVVTEKAGPAALQSAADVADFLRRHGVNADESRADDDGGTAATIMRLASERGADLIVAGAYGHSRFREWIFGGVTRDLLFKSPICCLMGN